MSAWVQRLAELGLELPDVARPVAAYVPARVHGDLVHVSGQLPSVRGAVRQQGRLGEDVTVEQGQEAARLATLNALAAAAAVAPGGAEAIDGVLRVEGYVQCSPDFHEQPQVVNGASHLLGTLFPGAGHVRLAVGCAALPLNAAVEVAVTFILAPRP